MYGPVVHLVEPSGCTPEGWGSGAEERGTRRAGRIPLEYGELDNVKYLWYNGGAGLPHNLKRESSLANN